MPSPEANATETTTGPARGPAGFFAKRGKKIPNLIEIRENGAGEETRTLDVYLGKVVLYQLSYARGAGCKK